MPIFNLIENSDNYLKTSGSLWQYFRDEQNSNILNYINHSFPKWEKQRKAHDDGNETNIEIYVSLKYKKHVIMVIKKILKDLCH